MAFSSTHPDVADSKESSMMQQATDEKYSDKDILPAKPDVVRKPPPRSQSKFRVGAHASREYASNMRGITYPQFLKALPPYIDDLTAELGDDLYERMRFDSQVESCLNVLAVGVLSNEGVLQSVIKDEDHKEYKLANEITEFCDRCTKRLETPLSLVLYEMFTDGTGNGHKVAEMVVEPIPDGDDYGRWAVSYIHTKPRKNVAFLVDVYNKVIGVMCIIPGMAYPIISGQLVQSPEVIPNLLPRQKFMIYTHNPKDQDPRGRSAFRCIYDPWWIKKQTIATMLRYLGKYGDPPLWGTTPENSEPYVPTDAAGNPIGEQVNPEQQMADKMALLSSSDEVAFPFGTMINALPVNVSTTNSVHLQVLTWCDQQISKGLLSQTLATEEGEHMARAAAEVHMDVLGLGARWKRSTLCAMVRSQYLHLLVEINWGKNIADRLTPDYVISDLDKEEWSQWIQAVLGLFTSGFISTDQKTWIEKKLGLPPDRKHDTDENRDEGHLPAIFVMKKLEMQMQMMAQELEQRQAAAQEGQQQQQATQTQAGGKSSPAHPNNQQPAKAGIA